MFLGKSKITQFTREQKRILRKYLKQDPDWSDETIEKVLKLIKMPRTKVYKYGQDKKRAGISRMIHQINKMPNIPRINQYSIDESLHIKDMNDAVNEIDVMSNKEYSYIKKLYDSVSNSVSQLSNKANNIDHKSTGNFLKSYENQKTEKLDLLDQIIEDDLEHPSFDYYKPTKQEQAMFDMYFPLDDKFYDPFGAFSCDWHDDTKSSKLNNLK